MGWGAAYQAQEWALPVTPSPESFALWFPWSSVCVSSLHEEEAGTSMGEKAG